MDDVLIRKIAIITAGSVLLPVLLSLLNYKSKPGYLKILGLLVLTSGLSDLLSINFVRFNNEINNIYIIVQFFILGSIFYLCFHHVRIKRLLLLSIFLYLIFSVINIFFIEGFTNRNTNLRTVSGITFIIISVYYFNYLLQNQPVDNIVRYPMFWINSAVLIYFSGNIFLYAANNIMSFEKIYLFYYLIHNMLNVIKNLLFSAAFIAQFLNLKRIDIQSRS
ncbi:MAG TPA: hypothetical protein VI583_13260 [Cyclobacteriaceae bacterium]|nr:hypothetical protein [Cyclobacteriaceae bacterium]